MASAGFYVDKRLAFQLETGTKSTGLAGTSTQLPSRNRPDGRRPDARPVEPSPPQLSRPRLPPRPSGGVCAPTTHTVESASPACVTSNWRGPLSEFKALPEHYCYPECFPEEQPTLLRVRQGNGRDNYSRLKFSDLDDQSREAERAWELTVGDIYHSIPTTAIGLFETLRSMRNMPLRLRIDVRAVAFGLTGYDLFQKHFFVSTHPEDDTVDRFIEAFNRTDTYQRPQLLFSFLETFLEYTDPQRLGTCMQRIISGIEPCSETLQRAAEVEIAELVVTFTTQCQVDPSQHHSGYAENTIIPAQLSIFGDFIILFRSSHHGTRRIFEMAAKRLQRRLRPLLLWLFVGSMPNRAKPFSGGGKNARQVLMVCDSVHTLVPSVVRLKPGLTRL
ncbi:hypothetical protein EPUS_05724 [Endocarpon pusillum Z07020]|uniref:Uncharacterized protein n=1 Tax=Endocarpon pusillum (strain Z07020 / HMAS-L-300199) TaxID=1263415 RepID=U1G9J6_ENDPU|nr:uncharacterized protein EPUS_05724 [Endocarpon pusillum Z07020]ERF68663.1 hypothetical protein EPUS_05724 [Endocarpon pusillum Z07020]